MRIIKVLFNLVELPLFIDNTGPNRAKCTRTYVRVHMYMYILHINPNTCLFLQKLYRTLVRYDVINIRGARHFKMFPFYKVLWEPSGFPVARVTFRGLRGPFSTRLPKRFVRSSREDVESQTF